MGKKKNSRQFLSGKHAPYDKLPECVPRNEILNQCRFKWTTPLEIKTALKDQIHNVKTIHKWMKQLSVRQELWMFRSSQDKPAAFLTASRNTNATRKTAQNNNGNQTKTTKDNTAHRPLSKKATSRSSSYVHVCHSGSSIQQPSGANKKAISKKKALWKKQPKNKKSSETSSFPKKIKELVYVDLDQVPPKTWSPYESDPSCQVIAACGKQYAGRKPSFVWCGHKGVKDEADCILLADFCSRYIRGELHDLYVRFISCDKIFTAIRHAVEKVLPRDQHPQKIVVHKK